MGVIDGVTVDVMEMVWDGVALAAGVVLGLTEGEAEQGENSTSVAAGDGYPVSFPRPS